MIFQCIIFLKVMLNLFSKVINLFVIKKIYKKIVRLLKIYKKKIILVKNHLLLVIKEIFAQKRQIFVQFLKFKDKNL